MRPAYYLAVVLWAGLSPAARADESACEQLCVCSYLKDIEAKMQKECDAFKEQAQWASLLAAKPNLIAEASKRRTEVGFAYKALKESYSLGNVADDKVREKSKHAYDLARTDPPVNERTFPAWYPDDQKLLDTYKKWVAAANEELRMSKGDAQNPVSEERRKEIDALLANNKVFLARLNGDINTPDKFRCFIGDDCGQRADVTDKMGVLTVSSRKGKDFDFDAEHRPYKLGFAAPGGKIDKGTPSPETVPEASKDSGKGGGGWKKWAAVGGIAAASLFLGGGANIDLGGGKSSKKNGLWKTAEREVAKQSEEAEKSAVELAEQKKAVDDAALKAAKELELTADESALVDRWRSQGGADLMPLDEFLGTHAGNSAGYFKVEAVESLKSKLKKGLKPI